MDNILSINKFHNPSSYRLFVNSDGVIIIIRIGFCLLALTGFIGEFYFSKTRSCCYFRFSVATIVCCDLSGKSDVSIWILGLIVKMFGVFIKRWNKRYCIMCPSYGNNANYWLALSIRNNKCEMTDWVHYGVLSNGLLCVYAFQL